MMIPVLHETIGICINDLLPSLVTIGAAVFEMRWSNGRTQDHMLFVHQIVLVNGWLITVTKVSSRKLLIQFTTVF